MYKLVTNIHIKLLDIDIDTDIAHTLGRVRRDQWKKMQEESKLIHKNYLLHAFCLLVA